MARDPVCTQVNAGELARVLGVSRKWIYNLTEQRGLPRHGRLYDVAECVQWYIASITERANDEPEDIMEARRRLYMAQTTKTKFEGERLRGRLVDLDEAESLLLKVASVVAAQLDAVAPRIAQLVAAESDQRTVQTLLFDEHRAIRESVADAIVEFSPPGRLDHPTAAETDGGPVGGSEKGAASGEP